MNAVGSRFRFSTYTVTRQRLDGFAVRAGACLLSAAFSASSVQAGELTFTSWGGSYAKAQLDTAVTPFSRSTGVKVRMEEYAGGVDELRGQVSTGKIVWDVVDLSLADALRACDEGLLEEIDPDELDRGVKGEPARGDFVPGALTRCYVATNVWSTVFAYNRKAFVDKAPQTIADVFDTARFPGKRGLRRTAQGNLEFALMADGVAVDQVYKVLSTPAGVERAFRKLDALKPHVVWWTAGAEPVEMLDTGKVQIASAYNGRIYTATLRGNKPLRYVWDGQLLSLEGLGIVKGTGNRKEAMAFVKYASSPAAMAALAPVTAYGPTRVSAAGLLDAVMMHVLPTAHWYAKRSLTVDARWWSVHGEALEQRFAAWTDK